MNINFNLATPQSKVSSIRVIVTQKGKVYRKAIGVSCPVKDWSATKQKCSHVEVDNYIRRVRIYLESVLNVNSTPDEIRNALEMAPLSDKERKAYLHVKEGRPSFKEVFCDTLKGATNASMYKTLCKMMGAPEWEDITQSWADVLISRMDSAGFSVNYCNQMLRVVKQAMYYGQKMKYHSNADFSSIVAPKEESFSVYLTKDEVDRLWNHVFDSECLSTARDIFIVGIYTASRHSDYSRLTMDNIHDGLLDFIQTKTGGRVVMPCAPRVIEVLQRHGGKVPFYCRHYLNRLAKRMCKEVGIDDVIEVPKSKRKILGKKDGEPVYKWELVGTHTARRTGATLLYLNNVPTIQCMMITGHKTEESFLKYIKVTKEENARALMNNPFFK